MFWKFHFHLWHSVCQQRLQHKSYKWVAAICKCIGTIHFRALTLKAVCFKQNKHHGQGFQGICIPNVPATNFDVTKTHVICVCTRICARKRNQYKNINDLNSRSLTLYTKAKEIYNHQKIITFIATCNDKAEKQCLNITFNQLFVRVRNTKESTNTSVVFSPGIYIHADLVQSCLNAEVTVPVGFTCVNARIMLKVTLENYKDHNYVQIIGLEWWAQYLFSPWGRPDV